LGVECGSPPGEYEAAGTLWGQRGKRADELIDALNTIWTTEPEFELPFSLSPAHRIGELAAVRTRWARSISQPASR
jgi:alkanesulfonate monooxygenase SsuD/methylene tetrahydromethanopterin reductase-like flavin-dependent oxidoreductase (luciferase family)